MAIRMASLKRSPSGSWSTRKVIPEDVRATYGKREDKITWPASLTHAEVRPLYAAWLLEVENKISSLRASKLPLAHSHVTSHTNTPVALSHSQQLNLRAGWEAWLHKLFWDLPEDDPASWDNLLDETEPLDPHATLDVRGRYEWNITPFVDGLIGRFSHEQSLHLTSSSLEEFRWQAVDATRDFAKETIKHLSTYRPPTYLTPSRAPQESTFSPAVISEPVTASITISDLFSSYIKERNPAPSSVKKFTASIKNLIAFVGHEDASRITKQDIQNWKDHLLGAKKLTAKTVKEGYLAAAKVTFNWGKENDLIASNPVADVKVRAPKTIKTRDKALTTEEATTILRESLKFSDPAVRTFDAVRRWAPWLCAYTGARINEITQLRSKDVRLIDGVHCIHITPDAGSVKSGEYRNVPLHDHIIAQGFLAYVKAADGHLFYDPANGRGGSDANPQSKKAGERLAKWAREIGVDDPNVSPNHGWRHRFKTEARLAGIDTYASDAITGHKSGTEGSLYGSWPMPALKRELDKLATIDPLVDRVT